MDLSKHETLGTDLKAIQQINLDRPGNTTVFFIIEEAK